MRFAIAIYYSLKHSIPLLDALECVKSAQELMHRHPDWSWNDAMGHMDAHRQVAQIMGHPLEVGIARAFRATEPMKPNESFQFVIDHFELGREE